MDANFMFVAIDTLATLLGEALRAYFLTRLLDMPRPKLFFFTFFFANYPVAMLLRVVIPANAAVVGALAAFALFYFIWPMVMSRGAVWPRVLACILVIVQVFLCEIVGSTFYQVVTGFTAITYENYLANPAAYVLARVFHLLLTLATLIAIEWVLRRLHFGKFAKTVHVERNGASTFPAIAFTMLQAVVLVCVVSRQIRGVSDGSLAGLADPAFGLFAFAVLLLDLVLILAIRRYLESARVQGRVAAMQFALDGEISSYASVVSQVEETAKLRHDLRNQLQTVYSLHSRGETELAAQHYASMSRILSNIDDGTSLQNDGASSVPRDRAGSVALSPLAIDDRGMSFPALSMPWVPWAPIALQIAFSAYVLLAYAGMGVSPAVMCLMVALLAAGMIAAVWLKQSLTVSTELETNKYQASVLETQVEAQRKRAALLAAQEQEAVGIRCRIARELEALAEDLGDPDASGDEAFDRAFDAVKLLDVGKRWSQNPVVDALVAAKAHQFEEAGVALEAELDIPREVGLPSTALCAAFSNMLDNALAAARQVVDEGGVAVVEVQARQQKGFLMVTTQNPVSANGASLGNRENASARGGISEHGWGQGILQSLADRYGGDFTFGIEDGLATTTLVMNAQTA